MTQKRLLQQLSRYIAHGSVKSYAQNRFWNLVEIHYRGRLNRPLVTFQQAGRKGSRAAVRRLPCPWRIAAWLLLHGQGFRLHHVVAGCMSFATTFFQEITSYSFRRSSSPNAICGARIWRLGADLEVAASVLFTIDKNRQFSKKDCRFFLFAIH